MLPSRRKRTRGGVMLETALLSDFRNAMVTASATTGAKEATSGGSVVSLNAYASGIGRE
ncbi:MAG TPA: hypothetical protein VKE70_32770 [Candidatus Solibacter sp.]|nr:hypothetical protein [Candidatus Solibacter sp.]